MSVVVVAMAGIILPAIPLLCKNRRGGDSTRPVDHRGEYVALDHRGEYVALDYRGEYIALDHRGEYLQ